MTLLRFTWWLCFCQFLCSGRIQRGPIPSTFHFLQEKNIHIRSHAIRSYGRKTRHKTYIRHTKTLDIMTVQDIQTMQESHRQGMQTQQKVLNHITRHTNTSVDTNMAYKHNTRQTLQYKAYTHNIRHTKQHKASHITQCTKSNHKAYTHSTRHTETAQGIQNNTKHTDKSI